MYTEDQLQDIVIYILTRSVRKKLGLNVTFETTEKEDAFFRELVEQTAEAKLNPFAFYFEPMSNKSFSVMYGSYPIGKIKLKGQKTYMQILSGLYTIKELHDLSLDDYISYIPKWIKHIKYCLKD